MVGSIRVRLAGALFLALVPVLILGVLQFEIARDGQVRPSGIVNAVGKYKELSDPKHLR